METEFPNAIGIVEAQILIKPFQYSRKRENRIWMKYREHFYRPQLLLRKVNVFTPVCDSVHRGVSGQTPFPQAGKPHPPPPPGRHPHPETATAADGMHPTGMHSCVVNASVWALKC